MASKGPEAFRTISEVADDLDLPQHVLRFWETRFTQIKPMKRGGGRRYYRPDDIELLRGIRTLLYSEGYTIRGVQRILKEQGPRVVIAAGKGAVSSPDESEDDAPPAPRRLRRAPPVHAAAAAAGIDHEDAEEEIEAEVEDAEADDNDAADDDGGELAADEADDAADDGDEDEAADDDEDGGPGDEDDADEDEDDDAGDSDEDDGDEDDSEEDDSEEDDDERDDEGNEDEGEEADTDADAQKQPRVEPAFNPREFRSRATPTTAPRAPAAPGRPPALSPEDFRRLNATLADLLELKRTLDQARG